MIYTRSRGTTNENTVNNFDNIITLLSSDPKVVVLTGAGISAESGIPVFRDPKAGLWKDFDPQEVATREGFLRNPRRVWEWYGQRRQQLDQIRPNPGHEALASLEAKLSDFTLVTQNIDDLHRLAGSKNIIELHGNLKRYKCFDEDQEVDRFSEDGPIPPRCPRCGGMVRPDVVWFGEILPAAALESAFAKAQDCDLFFSIGTSTVVEPAASLPFIASRYGAKVVEINIEPTDFTPEADFFLQGPSGKILPALLESLRKSD